MGAHMNSERIKSGDLLTSGKRIFRVNWVSEQGTTNQEKLLMANNLNDELSKCGFDPEEAETRRVHEFEHGSAAPRGCRFLILQDTATNRIVTATQFSEGLTPEEQLAVAEAPKNSCIGDIIQAEEIRKSIKKNNH